MTDDEIALRAALNVLRDSIESGRMPSGQPLTADARTLHEKAVDRLGQLATVKEEQTASRARFSAAHDAELGLPIDRHGNLGLFEVTNFAIDCRFMENAMDATSAEDLKTKLSSEHFHGLCYLWDDSRPEFDRKFEVNHYARSEYWQRVHSMLPDVLDAVHIVKDMLQFWNISYQPEERRFGDSDRGDTHSVRLYALEAVFDYPNFPSFRYAYLIIKSMTDSYSTKERDRKGGELDYSIHFWVMAAGESAALPAGRRTSRLQRFALKHGLR